MKSDKEPAWMLVVVSAGTASEAVCVASSATPRVDDSPLISFGAGQDDRPRGSTAVFAPLAMRQYDWDAFPGSEIILGILADSSILGVRN